jgi:hypothetical protein
MPQRTRAATAVAAVGVLLALAGCAGSGAAPQTAPDVTASADTNPGDGVSVSVYQPRPDVAAGRIAIQVHNDSGEELIIEAAALTSSYFVDPLEWPAPREVDLGAGRAVDLRVQLGPVECAEPNPAEHAVTISYRLGDGASQTAELTPSDEFGVLELLHDAGCLDQRVGEVVTLTAQSVAVPGEPGVPTTLTITAAPTGAAGEVAIDTVTSTTLLAPFDGVSGVSELPVGIVVGAGGPREITIPLVPNRCDPHALAEDKVGTRIPLLVRAPDGTEGRLVLAASDELRGQMYAFYSSFCGLG